MGRKVIVIKLHDCEKETRGAERCVHNYISGKEQEFVGHRDWLKIGLDSVSKLNLQYQTTSTTGTESTATYTASATDAAAQP